MKPEAKLDPATIQKVARLAHLQIDAAQQARVAQEIAGVLAYIDKINELDLDDVAETSHGVDLPTKLRPDQTAPGLPIHLALQNAPEAIGDGFGVPKIIE